VRGSSTATLIALVALVVALSGVGQAADIPSRAKGAALEAGKAAGVVKRGPRGPRGPRGRRGPRGLRGLQGAQGPTGATGPAGATGASGASFTVNTTLGSGQTETGSWGIGGGTSDWAHDTITYRIPLATTLANAVYLGVGAPPTAQCPGPAQAAPGYLCVYGREGSGTANFSSIYHHESGNGISVAGSGRFGFLIYFSTTANSTYQSGDWAVTAP
jgi:hypothetical protein